MPRCMRYAWLANAHVAPRLMSPWSPVVTMAGLPCADALVAAGVSRVVAAMQDPNPHVAGRGLYRLQQAGIEVRHGLMLAEAEAVNKGFLKRMRTGFPYVQLKLGASLDGRTAMASGEPVDHLCRRPCRRAALSGAELGHLKQ